MTPAKLIHKIVTREAKRARRPQVYKCNREEFLWQVYQVEGMPGLVDKWHDVTYS